MNQSKNSGLLTWFFSSDFLRDATNWTSFFQSTKEPTDATTKTATKKGKERKKKKEKIVF